MAIPADDGSPKKRRKNPYKHTRKFLKALQAGGGPRRRRYSLVEKLASSRTTNQIQQDRLRQQVRERASQRLLQQDVQYFASQRAKSQRDRMVQQRIEAIQQDIRDRDLMSRAQQDALDAGIKNKLATEGLQFDAALISKQDADTARQQSEEAARAVLNELRQAAYQQSQSMASAQIARLVLLSKAEQEKLFQQRALQIAADANEYVRARELAMLIDIRTETSIVSSRLQGQIGISTDMLAQTEYFLPILREKTESAAESVNTITAYLSQKLLQAVYDITGTLDAQAILYGQASGLVTSVQSLRAELLLRIDAIMKSDSAIPSLLQTRSELIPKLNLANMELNALIGTIGTVSNPTLESNKVAEQLRKLQSDLQEAVQQLYQAYTQKIGQIASKQIAYDSATKARMNAQVNQHEVMQSVQSAATLAVGEFSQEIDALKADAVTVGAFAETVLRPTRDAYALDAGRTKTSYEYARDTLLPAADSALQTYTQTVVTPAETARNSAADVLATTRQVLTGIDLLNQNDRQRMNGTLLPAVAGGRPTKSAALIEIESRMEAIRTYLDVTLPSQIQGGIATANGSKLVADSLYQVVADFSSLFRQLQADRTSSDLSMQAYESAFNLLAGLRQRIGTLLLNAKNISDSVETFTRENLGRFSQLYKQIFSIQIDYFRSRSEEAKIAKTDARDLASKDTTTADSALSIAQSLNGKLSTYNVVDESIRIFDGLLFEARVKLSRNSGEAAVIRAQTTLDDYTQNVLNPKSTDVSIDVTTINTSIRSRDALLPDLAPLLLARDAASTALSNAKTNKGVVEGQKIEKKLEMAGHEIQLQNAQDLLTVKNVRAAAYTYASGLKSRYLGDRNTLQLNQSSLVIDKTRAATDAAVARNAALGQSSDALSIVSKLDQKAPEVVSLDQPISVLETQAIPFANTQSEYANLNRVILANIRDTNQGALIAADGRVQRSSIAYETAKGDADRQIGIVKGNVDDASAGSQRAAELLPDLDTAERKKNAASTNLETVKSLRENDKISRDEYDLDLQINNSRIEQLKTVLNSISLKSFFKGLYERMKQTYSDVKDTYNDLRRSSNEKKVNNEITNKAFIATQDFFSTVDALNTKTNTLNQLPASTTYDAYLQQLRGQLDLAQSQFEILKTTKKEIDTRKSLDSILPTLESASTIYNTYMRDTLNPKITDRNAYLDLVNTATRLANDLSTLLSKRNIAFNNLDTARRVKEGLERFKGILGPLHDLLRLEEFQTASREELLAKRAAFSTAKSNSDGAKQSSKTAKEVAGPGANAARSTALQTDLSIAGTLDTKTKEMNTATTNINTLDGAILFANYALEIATSNKNSVNLKLLVSTMGSLIQSLAGINISTYMSTVSSDQTAVDTARSNLESLLQALNTARENRLVAEQKRDDTIDLKNTDTRMKRTLNDTISQLQNLLRVLNSFSQTVSDRTSQRGSIMGLIQYYRSLKGQFNTRTSESRQTKESSAVNTTNSFSANLSQINEIASQVGEKSLANNIVATEIQRITNLLEVYTNVRDGIILERLNDPTSRLRALLAQTLAEQQKYDATVNTIQTIELEISNLNQELNRTGISEAYRDSLFQRLQLLLQQRLELYEQLRQMEKEMQKMRERILELLNEINALRQTIRQLQNRLPIMFFLPVTGIILGMVAIPALLSLPGAIGTKPENPELSEVDCAEAKKRGYEDGFTQGAQDGFKRGYEDAKKQFQKDRNAAYLANLQNQGQEAAPPPEEEEAQTQEQAGGAGEEEDPYAEKEPEEASDKQLYQLPSNYTVPVPDKIPTPNASQIIVPQLPGVSPQYQFCYADGYIDGYKDGFNSTYLKGFKSFIPSQEAFLPMVQEEGEEEEKPPTQDDFGYAPPAAAYGPAPPVDDRIAPAQTYPTPEMDEAYRERYARIDRSQFP